VKAKVANELRKLVKIMLSDDSYKFISGKNLEIIHGFSSFHPSLVDHA